MRHIKLSDISIACDSVGTGEPVLLVSGLGGAASWWQPNLQAFAGRYQVVLHDHRGTGRSTAYEGAYSVEMLADDLLAVMDELGLRRAHLVGHSTGGAIGQVLAARAPDRVASLVLYASWAVLEPQMKACLELRRSVLRALGPEDYHRATPIFLYPPRHVRDHAPLIEQEIAAAIGASPPASILDARVTGILDFDGRPYLSKIRCPTLVLVAQDDILTPPYSSELLHEGIAQSRLSVLGYGAHGLSRTDPRNFEAAVLDFLAEHPMVELAHARG